MSFDQPILGIPELDAALLADLTPGWLGLICGPTGSGTHLLAKQFAAEGRGSSPVLFYTTNETTANLQKSFRDYGWDPESIRIENLDDEYFDRVLARQLEVSRTREQGLTAKQLLSEGGLAPLQRPFSLTSRILADIAKLETPFRLVVDSIDFLIEILGAAEVVTLARQIRRRAQALGGQSMLVLHPGIHDAHTTGLLEEIADVVVELNVVPDAKRGSTEILVQKLRLHPERNRRFVAEMTDNGMRVARSGAPESRR